MERPCVHPLSPCRQVRGLETKSDPRATEVSHGPPTPKAWGGDDDLRPRDRIWPRRSWGHDLPCPFVKITQLLGEVHCYLINGHDGKHCSAEWMEWSRGSGGREKPRSTRSHSGRGAVPLFDEAKRPFDDDLGAASAAPAALTMSPAPEYRGQISSIDPVDARQKEQVGAEIQPRSPDEGNSEGQQRRHCLVEPGVAVVDPVRESQLKAQSSS